MMNVKRHNKFNAYDPWHDTPHSQHKQSNFKIKHHIYYNSKQICACSCALCYVIVFLYICVCAYLLQNNNHKTKHKNNNDCGSAFEPGASGLPYYCASICVRSCTVIGVLAVWIQNQKQKQKSPAQNTKHQFSMKTTLSKHKNNNDTTNNSNSHIHSQHTNTSLHNWIP